MCWLFDEAKECHLHCFLSWNHFIRRQVVPERWALDFAGKALM